MYELKVTVTKIRGACTADPPMKPGDFFTVRDGNIRIPQGGYICAWALQSILPLITPKERRILEEKDQDWMWRVDYAQCPDPKGCVRFKIEQVAEIDAGASPPPEPILADKVQEVDDVPGSEGGLQTLRVVVEEVRGKCTSGMKPGDFFLLRSGRLYIPAGKHFCLYALHAALPFLPAKQRPLPDGDWMKREHQIICPDPAGNVIMRIEPVS